MGDPNANVEVEKSSPVGHTEALEHRTDTRKEISMLIDKDEDLSDYGALPTLPRITPRNAVKDLVWDNLTVTIPGKCRKPGKEILKSSSGRVKPGEFVAIMGPSGAGKTTLLNTLAGRCGSVEVSGSVSLGGREMGRKEMRQESAYVMQEDALYATATVRESFDFSAALRLKATINDEARLKIVDQMLKAMGLTKAADTMVGSVMIKGVSGGEKKRTAIGVELLSDPNIIFLDEPTSGLDSYAAFKVVTLLRSLCATGCMVITTIHQPSSEVFALFDRTFLLADGNTVYDGPVSTIPKYFAMLGKPCPKNFNPADHIMFVMQMAGNEKLAEYGHTWKANHNEYNAKVTEADKERQLEWERAAEDIKLYEKRAVLPQFFREVRYLGMRELRNVARDRTSIIAAVGTTVFINLIVGAIFLNQGDWGPTAYQDINLTKYDATEPDLISQSAVALFDSEDQGQFQQNIAGFVTQLRGHFGALTLIAIGGLFGLAQPTILSFPLERPIFLREYANRNYSWVAYFLSKFPKELFVCLLQSGILVLVSYFLVAFKGNFVFIWLSIALLGLSVSSCAMLLGAVASDVKVAIQLSPLILVPQLLFSGFQLPISQIPEWLRWAQYLCSLKYAVSLFNIIEFDQPDVPYDIYNRVQIDQFLKEQETDPKLWYIYVVVLLVIFLGFRLLALLALALKAL